VHEDDDTARVGVEPVFGAGAPVERHVRGEVVEALGHQVGDHAEVLGRGPPVAVRVADDRDVHGRGVLDGARVGAHRDDVSGTGGDLDGLPRPQPPDGVEVGVHEVAVRAEVVRREREVGGVPAARHAEPDPAAGQVVHDGPLLGDPDGVVQREYDRAGV
jgi:hypothetical protein